MYLKQKTKQIILYFVENVYFNVDRKTYFQTDNMTIGLLSQNRC